MNSLGYLCGENVPSDLFFCLSGCWIILNQLSKVSLFPKGFFLFFYYSCQATQDDFQVFLSIANRIFSQNLPIWPGLELG